MQYLYHQDNNLGDKPLNEFLIPRLFSALENSDVNILGVGSLLGILPCEVAQKPICVWSSGFQYDDGSRLRNPQYYCVRGKLTCEKLGISPDYAVADGAILLPLFIPKVVKPSKKVGVVMKYMWEGPQEDWLWTSKVEEGKFVQWIENLWQYESIITDSLHVAIISDAYGIPWRATRWEIKWEDHFEQMNCGGFPENLTLSKRKILEQRQCELFDAASNLVKDHTVVKIIENS